MKSCSPIVIRRMHPVVTAAKKALEKANVSLIPPYGLEKSEGEIKKALERPMAVRKQGRKSPAAIGYPIGTVVPHLLLGA